MSTVAMAGRRRRDQFREFIEEFFVDEINNAGEDYDLQDVLEGLMLPGDVRKIDQAPANRDLEVDLVEGWVSEEGDLLNMPFDGRTHLNVDDNFPDDPQPIDFFSLFIFCITFVIEK